MMRLNGMFFFLYLTLVASACVLQTDDVAAHEDEMEGSAATYDDSVEAVTLGDFLDMMRVVTRKKIRFGGTRREEDHYHDVGKRCSRGYVRVDPPQVEYSGHGFCEFDAWVAPQTPSDCTASIRVHHAGGHRFGECRIEILEERPAPSGP